MAQNSPASPGPKSAFDIGTPAGLALGFGAIIVAFLMEGGSIVALIQISAGLIVFGGTFATLLIAFPLKTVMGLPKYLAKAFFEVKDDPLVTVNTFVRLADKARREGLLSLEDEAQHLENAFVRDGIQEVVDGTPPERIQEILEIRIAEMEARHREGKEVFEGAGGFAPTMGIIGTVMGLVTTLSKLATAGTESLGESISTAFIATLYGIMSANLFWLPVAARLKRRSDEEVSHMRMMVAGILAIQAGEGSRAVRTILEGFLSPADVARLHSGSQAEGGLAAEPAAA